MSHRCLLYGLPLLLLIVTVGCGPTDSLNRQAISGTVTLDGQPLENGTIEMVPVDAGEGVASGANITDGSYEIPQEKGLPPGKYTVRISAAAGSPTKTSKAPPGEGDVQPAEERIPARYNAQSELTAEVTDGSPNTFDFELESN